MKKPNRSFPVSRNFGWLLAAAAAWTPSFAAAQIRITEYMYSGNGAAGEFVEFTNVGLTPIDMNGWSYDDDSAVPGTISLSAFGVVAPGEAVVLAEATEPVFRSMWGLAPAVKIIGANSSNLSRNDQINLFDNTSALVDTLSYGDQTFPGTIRTQGASGWPCSAVVGLDMIGQWNLATVGDPQGSFSSSEGNIGRPGVYVSFNCPPPGMGACCEAGVCNNRTSFACAPLGLYQGDGTNCGSTMCPAPTNAMVRITEYLHGGNAAEFIEFTNLGALSVDMTDWSYSDIGRFRGQVDLTGLGILDPGESAILTDAIAGDFITDWQLSGVTVLGGNVVNIGVDDEINLYDLSGAQVDRLSYGPIGFPNSIDADGAAGWPCASAVGGNDIYNWRAATVGDAQTSHLSFQGDIGNPGDYTGVTCSPGACCIAGSCSIKTLQACSQMNGLFQGDGTNCISSPCPMPSNAEVRITEFMYQGIDGEFVEFTNLDTSPVDMTGWSFSDTGTPGSFDLSGFTTIQPGESVIMTAEAVNTFRGNWSLAPAVKIVRIPSDELGRNDVIQLYDDSGTLVDELHYGDELYPGTPHTLNVSAWARHVAVGEDLIDGWQLSVIADELDSYASASGDVGNPGDFELIGPQVPTMSEWGLTVLFLAMLTAGTLAIRRRNVIA